MYTIDDIDVLIYTHNREELLRETIESIENQTIIPSKIIILDNGSIDDTENMVKSLEYSNLEYQKTFGQHGNYLGAKKVISKKFVMTFHDDDILNPQFFEKILQGLNYFNEKGIEIGLCASLYSYFECSDDINIEKLKAEYLLINNSEDLINIVSRGAVSPAFCSYIYNSEVYKKVDNIKLWETYGKASDLPSIVENLEKCNLPLMCLNDKNAVFVRTHALQDSYSEESCYSIKNFNSFYDFLFKYVKIEYGLLDDLLYYLNSYFMMMNSNSQKKFIQNNLFKVGILFFALGLCRLKDNKRRNKFDYLKYLLAKPFISVLKLEFASIGKLCCPHRLKQEKESVSL